MEIIPVPAPSASTPALPGSAASGEETAPFQGASSTRNAVSPPPLQ